MNTNIHNWNKIFWNIENVFSWGVNKKILASKTSILMLSSTFRWLACSKSQIWVNFCNPIQFKQWLENATLASESCFENFAPQFHYQLVVITSVMGRSNGCGDWRCLSLLLAHFLMLIYRECSVWSGAALTTAPRLGNAVSAGHWPRLVSINTSSLLHS